MLLRLNGDDPVSTLTQDFHTRLDNLLRTLVHAKPHFIRCVRANNSETPGHFDRSVVSRQVRALQVLETVNLMAGGKEGAEGEKNVITEIEKLTVILIGSARLPTPDEVQSVQRSLQDAGAVQTAEKSRRQGAGRLQFDPSIFPSQHDVTTTQGFERQYQLVAGQETHLP